MDERSDEDIAFAIFKLDERIASLERNRSSIRFKLGDLERERAKLLDSEAAINFDLDEAYELARDMRAELRGRMGRKEPE